MAIQAMLAELLAVSQEQLIPRIMLVVILVVMAMLGGWLDMEVRL